MAGRSGFDYRQPRDVHAARTTILKTGTGTFLPLQDGVRASVVVVGGGGGGGHASSANGGGGCGGCTVFLDIPLFFGGMWTYTVGGGGVAGNGSVVDGGNGGSTFFGPFEAPGGLGGLSHNSTRLTAATSLIPGAISGGVGGLGYPKSTTDDLSRALLMCSSTPDYRQSVFTLSSYRAGCGGSTPFGIGGHGEFNGAGSGFGAGGRGGGSNGGPYPGLGGVIIITEFEG